MPKYKDDPRQITAGYGRCETCETELAGKQAYYWPKGRHVYCLKCGEQSYREFLSAAADEDNNQCL
jgi:hypothetical protein